MNRRFMFVAVLLSSLPLAALAQESGSGGIGGVNVGVAAGYLFPQSILEPNTVGVRVRMGALTFEPLLAIGGGSGKQTDTTTFTSGTTTNTTTSSDSSNGFNVNIAGNFLYQIANAGPMSLHAIGGVELDYETATTKPNFTAPITELTSTDTTTSVGLSWGLGIEWAFTKNFVASAEATNPLVTWYSIKSVDRVVTNVPSTAEVTQEDTGFAGGLALMPSVRLLFILYF